MVASFGITEMTGFPIPQVLTEHVQIRGSVETRAAKLLKLHGMQPAVLSERNPLIILMVPINSGDLNGIRLPASYRLESLVLAKYGDAVGIRGPGFLINLRGRLSVPMPEKLQLKVRVDHKEHEVTLVRDQGIPELVFFRNPKLEGEAETHPRVSSHRIDLRYSPRSNVALHAGWIEIRGPGSDYLEVRFDKAGRVLGVVSGRG